MLYSGLCGALDSRNPDFDGKDPTSIFAVTKTTHRNFPDDWDWNIHMNNEYLISSLHYISRLQMENLGYTNRCRSYAKISDIARMHATFNVFPNASFQITKRTVEIVVAGVTARFIREI